MDPDTLTRLAAVFQSGAESEATRMQALGQIIAAYGPASLAPGPGRRMAGELLAEVLTGRARSAARWAAQSGASTQREDFVEEALSLLFLETGQPPRPRICRFDPEGRTLGELSRWLRQTLSHCWADQCRYAAARPSQRLGDLDPEHDGHQLEALRERILDPCTPFPADYLVELQKMPPVHRIETLSVAVLWKKIPGQRWETWLRAYEKQRARTLPRPFPPEELLWQDNLKKRCETLAPLFGSTWTALMQRWYRQLPLWLGRLTCYRELEEG